MVKKPDGSWRCCGDYRHLNNVTVPNTYPLPYMMDFSSRVAGCSIFTKIDLRKGYYQIPMHPADILKTAIITPFRLFKFLCLTFGLRNAGSTFQRPMDRVLAGLAFAFVYLDNIIIASPSMEQHQQDVEEVFRWLQAASLVINFEKCTFAIPEVDFLGYRVSASWFAPLPSRPLHARGPPLHHLYRPQASDICVGQGVGAMDSHAVEQLSYVAKFTTDIQHIPGSENIVADDLS
jgi:hypothetical protein